MKKWYLFGGVAVVAVAAVVIVVVNGHSGSSKDGNAGLASNASKGFSSHLKNACDILTPTVAKNVLGADAKSGSNVGDTEANDVKVTNCIYTSASSDTTLSLMVRAAESQVQADSNAAQFDGKTNIPGYGDKAYWDADMGQLNILAHENWYILSNGPLHPTDHTLADSQKLADAIKNSL